MQDPITDQVQPPRPRMRGRSSLGLLLRAGALAAVATALVLLSMPRDGEQSDVALAGREEPVFVWSRDACEPLDVPDTPARAFRDASGQVHLNATSYVNRKMVGPDLDRLRHPCEATMASDYDPDPAKFADREWITSPYTTDGKNVFALVHNEYQGNQHPGGCPVRQYHPCWYNTITLAASTDGGNTYAQAPAPTHLVASVPYTYAPGKGPYGLFAPSNIVHNPKDNYYYTLVKAEQFGEQPRGTCVLRTRDLSRPTSWRAWDGDGFSVSFVNPYQLRAREPVDAHICQPLDRSRVGQMSQSLTYNTYFEKFMLVGVSSAFKRAPRSGGIYFSLSDDLINWSTAKLIKDVEHTWTYVCGDRDPIMYPSIIDPRSRSRNFETAGREPYLYFTRVKYDNGCKQTLDRDLLRIRVRFSK